MAKTGSFAEYRDGITTCPECGNPLSDNPAEPPRNVKKVYNDFLNKILVTTGLKIDSDLVNKILITIGLLIVYHLLYLIPVPGVHLTRFSNEVTKRYFLSRFSINALGIMPYISAYILVEVFSLVVPTLKRWRGEKQEGRRKLTVAAKWLTLIICLVQGFGICVTLERMTNGYGSMAVIMPGPEFGLIVIITLTACVFVNLWIADLITFRGIGNGISMLIFSGAAVRLYSGLVTSFKQKILLGENFMDNTVTMIFVLLIIFAAGAFILFMERGEYNIKVNIKNNGLVDLPFKYNTAGIEPAVFAASFVMIPATFMRFYSWHPEFFGYFRYGTLTYFITCMIILIFLFFLFTSLYFDPDKILSFLKKKNGEPVLPEGVSLEKLLDKKLTLFAVWGTVYLCVYSVLLRPGINIYIVVSGLVLIRFVAASLDIINEVKTRKKYGCFVKIDEIQKPYEAKFIKNLLEQKGIPCFLEGYYHRSIYYFFGPFIGISIYVQRDKETEALKVISDESDEHQNGLSQEV